MLIKDLVPMRTMDINSTTTTKKKWNIKSVLLNGSNKLGLKS